MPEICPPRTALIAFSSGRLAELERDVVQNHLSTCLDCARQLESITRQELSKLGTELLANNPAFNSPAIAQLIATAREGFSGSHPSAEAAVREALDPPIRSDTLGRFAGHDVLEVAGSGGMGVVLKAHDPMLHRDVALKILSPNRAWDEDSAERFLNEARTIASLQHDNVVAIYSAGREKGLPYLVMPFHVEGTLEQWLQRTPILAATDVTRIGLQLARALAATHAKGVLHRDIKPSNVLLEGGLERVRLADFGLAQPVGQDTRRQRKDIAGTPDYMSPEQARGETIDARSDLFSLGALLHQLASGQTIRADGNTEDVLERAARGEAVAVRATNPKLQPALAKIIDRLLAPRREDRFGSADEVAAILEHLANRATRRNRWIKRGAATVLAACIVSSASIVLLDASGRTAVINTLLCRRRGVGFYVRARFGTYTRLADAVAAARPHDIIEVCFSGERKTDGFRSGAKPLVIRAAHGFRPQLVATNSGQALILADGPLAIEGLTFWRRSNRLAFSPLISVQAGSLHLLNCRVGRTPRQGEDPLVRDGRRVGTEEDFPADRPIIMVSPGSTVRLQNCVLVGQRGTGLGLLNTSREAIRVETDNSLFVIHRAFALRPRTGTPVELRAMRSVFVTAALLDVNDAEALGTTTVMWEDCFLDFKGGVLLRVSEHGDGTWMRAMTWRETNVVYAADGTFLSDQRGGQIVSETRWNGALRLATNGHRLTDHDVFVHARQRSSQSLRASDLDLIDTINAAAGGHGFVAGQVGEGEPYEIFRRTAEYRAWQRNTRIAMSAWKALRP